MDSQITSELIGLGIIVLSSLGILIRAKINKIVENLDKNTAITTQARDASNGQLSSVIAQLAAERNLVTGLRAVVRERDDRISYIIARFPAVESLMREYSDRRATRATDADVIAAENHLLSE